MSQKYVKDVEGLIKGLNILRKNINVLQAQRVNGERKLTDRQRMELANQQKMKAEEQKLADEEEQVFQQMKKMQAEQQAPPEPEPVAVQKEEPKPKKASSEYIIDKNKGNALYLKLQEQRLKMEEEAGENTFGKSRQQTAVVDNQDIPFFMRQDRPKFSTVERYVPSSPASRMMHFGLLGIQLMGGTLSEAVKQKVGMSQQLDGVGGVAKYALNEKNVERLALNFKKMRGGALKIGQFLSTSEDTVMPPILREAFEKVRSEADIMPLKQVTKSLIKEYGPEWQSNFKEINLYPFAAASIGQVHEAILKDNTRVALKIQYSGIANSIDSDINNFNRIIDLLGIFPKGLYLKEAIEVARGELHWECDYEREAAYQLEYRKHLLAYPSDFYCPQVIDHLSTKQILCSEFIDGLEIDTFMNADQQTRNRIGSLLIKLCFKELFEFKMMQTDPNPANYLFDQERDIMNLIDLGSGRDFDNHFLDCYMQIIMGAMELDRDKVIYYSESIGFLTGEESIEMYDAQYKGTLVVGEPFRTANGDLFDYGQAGLMSKIGNILPTLSKHRLTPPPQEVYSLHKKIVGAYLMCIKLRAQVPAREILLDTYDQWKRLHGKDFNSNSI